MISVYPSSRSLLSISLYTRGHPSIIDTVFSKVMRGLLTTLHLLKYLINAFIYFILCKRHMKYKKNKEIFNYQKIKKLTYPHQSLIFDGKGGAIRLELYMSAASIVQFKAYLGKSSQLIFLADTLCIDNMVTGLNSQSSEFVCDFLDIELSQFKSKKKIIK